MDYSKINFKAGLEIHQQLDTGKLFCSCPSYLRSDEPQFTITRKLHAVAGETGIVDAAVAHEALLDREFMYQGYHETTCLVELDEEPPHEINQSALQEALKIALLLNCEPYPCAQIMRKLVIDGSNTSGFQRTMLIARDGYIETSFGKVPIETVCLEEDAARLVSEKSGSQIIFRLDRLGIPLVEIATAPAITDPAQIKEAALKLGEILRACKVKRGIGTIRQDINISVQGGQRIEIKGFQDPAMMQTTAQYEAQRQLKLMEIHQQLKSYATQKYEIVDLTTLLHKSSAPLIQQALHNKGVVLGVKLPGFANILGTELQPGKRFGTEVAFYARLQGAGGIMHADENLEEKYKLTTAEIHEIKEKLTVSEKDSFIIIADSPQVAQKSLQAALLRCQLQTQLSVPPEVRNAQPDGTTSFLRPLPGKARMYPETDLPLLKISRDSLNAIKKSLPKLKTEIRDELKKKGVSDELVILVLDGNVEEFTILAPVYPRSANLVAKAITLWRAEIATKLNKQLDEIKAILTERVLEHVLEAVNEGKIVEHDVKPVLLKIASGTSLEHALKVEKVDENELEHEIAKIVKASPGLRANAYMGAVIQKLGAHVDKRKAMEILNKLTNNNA